MADNVTAPPSGTGTATPVIATDDVGGVHYQKVKLDVGGDGATTPVSGTLPVSGTVTATVPPSTTGTLTSVAATTGAGGAQLLASNASRKAAIIYNDSTAVLYVALTTTVSATSFTYLVPPGGLLELAQPPNYTGSIFGIWAAANGSARVTELT